jgi:hypothetical protein
MPNLLPGYGSDPQSFFNVQYWSGQVQRASSNVTSILKWKKIQCGQESLMLIPL